MERFDVTPSVEDLHGGVFTAKCFCSTATVFSRRRKGAKTPVSVVSCCVLSCFDLEPYRVRCRSPQGVGDLGTGKSPGSGYPSGWHCEGVHHITGMEFLLHHSVDVLDGFLDSTEGRLVTALADCMATVYNVTTEGKFARDSQLQCELRTAEVQQIQFISYVVDIPCGTEANREFPREVHVSVMLPFLQVFFDVPIEVCESSDPRVCMRRRGRVTLRQSLASTTLLSRRRHLECRCFEELRHSQQWP